MRLFKLAPVLLLLGMGFVPESHSEEAGAYERDLSGVWYMRRRSPSSPQSLWSSAELPFTEYGREVFDNNVPGKGPRQTLPALGNDPMGSANPAGLLRTLIYFRPWEFIQLGDRVIQTFDLGKHWRSIWIDGRPSPGEFAAGPFWYGYSVGRWEGDTLLVTTNNLDGRQWIDDWGTPISEYDAIIEERWRRIDDGRLEMQITVIDAEIYSRPWQSDVLVYTRQTADSDMPEPLEQIHAPIDEALFNAVIRDPVAEGKTDPD